MPTVLWLTVTFPPRVNVSAVRNVKFIKYLGRMGWRSVVVCPQPRDNMTPAGQRLLDELPEDAVIARRGAGLAFAFEDRRFVSYVARSLFPPDPHGLWARLVRPAVADLIRVHNPDVVFTTCSPFSLNGLGQWVQQTYGLPWVTDFRDLWTLNPRAKRMPPHVRGLASQQERGYLTRCDALVVTSETSRRQMVTRYPFLDAKCHVITNGFDPEDLPPHDSASLPRTLFYGGSIYPGTSYSPRRVLALLAHLQAQGRLDPAAWRLHYAGRQGELLRAMVAELDLPLPVIDHGFLGQGEYVALLQQMAFAFFCMPSELDTRAWTPARLYDYMGSRCRIVGVAQPDSDVATILTNYGRGLVLDADASVAVQAQQLLDYLVQPSAPGMVDDTFVASFSRRATAAQLAALFRRVVAQPRGG